MPSLPIDTDWANAIGSFGYDGTRGPRAMLLGAQYTGELLDNERKKRTMAAVGPAVDAQMKSYDARFPYAAPMNDYNQFGPPSPVEQQTFEGDRATARQAMTMGGYLAKSPEDVAKAFYGMPALAEVSRGIPADKGRRDVMETMLGPMGAHMPGYDEAKMPTKGVVVIGADGKVLDGGLTKDGVNFLDGRRIPQPPGSQLQLQQPRAADAGNPYKGNPEMLNYLDGLAAKMRAGQPLSADETQRAGVILNQMHPVTNESQTINGRFSTVPIRKTEIPPQYGQLASLVDAQQTHPQFGNNAQHVPFAGVGAGMPVPPSVGGLAGVPTTPAPDPAAAAVPPVAPPTAAAPGALPLRGAPAGAVTPLASGDPHTVRQEITNLPSYKNYVQAIPMWNVLPEHFKTNSNAADLAAIYALAKLYDPGSVVREGELKMASSVGAIADRLIGTYSALAKGGGRLTKEQRIDLLNEGSKRMATYQQSWDADRKFYSEKVLPQAGIDPSIVIPELPPPAKWSAKDVASEARPSRPGAVPAPAGPVPAAPAAPTRTIRINPQTGAIEDVQ